MRKVLIITVMVAVTLAGMTGALLVRARAQASLKLEASATFVSFSEVENAKTVLQTLADQFILEIRQARASDYLVRVAQNQSAPAAEFKKTAARLLGALEEFRGTQQESALTRELLTLLHSARELGSWMDLYLGFVYRHPTDELVVRAGHDAVEVAAKVGRREELIRALIHVVRIPLTFDTKPEVQTLLIANGFDGSRARFARSQHEGVTPTPADMQL